MPINSSVLGKTAEQNRPEIAQIMFKYNENLNTNDLERNLFETRKKIEKLARENQLKIFIFAHLVQGQLYIKDVSCRNVG